MAESYIISIDQSTQGTKALLFDQDGMLLQRKDLPHKQMINEKGWVSHDPEEIYQNAVQVVKNLVEASESAIREKLLLSGKKRPEKQSRTLLSGNVQGPLKSAAVWRKQGRQR